MIIGLEGAPGAGKTTLVEALTQQGVIATVPEIMIDLEATTGEGDFIVNDELKSAAALASNGAIVDRSFMSTLAFNFAYEATFGRGNYDLVRGEIVRRIMKGSIVVPDAYIYLDIPIEVSLDRQSPTNDTLWRNPNIVDWSSRYFKHILGSAYPEQRLLNVDGRLPERQVLEASTEFILALREDGQNG